MILHDNLGNMAVHIYFKCIKLALFYITESACYLNISKMEYTVLI